MFWIQTRVKHAKQSVGCLDWPECPPVHICDRHRRHFDSRRTGQGACVVRQRLVWVLGAVILLRFSCVQDPDRYYSQGMDTDNRIIQAWIVKPLLQTLPNRSPHRMPA